MEMDMGIMEDSQTVFADGIAPGGALKPVNPIAC